jgi:Peptidase S24-like
MNDVRKRLQSLISERGTDYAALSRLLGRNAAYMQQFMHRGVPKRLAEEDRGLLARFFGVSEVELGGPSGAAGLGSYRIVPRLAVGASAGSGAFGEGEAPVGAIAFDPAWLKRLGVPDNAASIIAVQGDSMEPTLADGDEILVNLSDKGERLADGIYVIRLDDLLMVKRLAFRRGEKLVSIISDNAAYPIMDAINGKGLTIIGRAVWAAGQL